MLSGSRYMKRQSVASVLAAVSTFFQVGQVAHHQLLIPQQQHSLHESDNLSLCYTGWVRLIQTRLIRGST